MKTLFLSLTFLVATFFNSSAITVSFWWSNPSCYGSCNGSLVAIAAGGGAPYSYHWSDGHSTQTITGLCGGTYYVTVTNSLGATVVGSKTITQPALLTSALSSVAASCTLCNGYASVSVFGGTTPYTYHWSNGATTASVSSLCAATYSLTVTDSKSCSVSNTTIISSYCPAPTNLSATSIAATSAQLNWVSTCLPFAYIAYFRKVGTFTWTTYTIGTNYQVVTGLLPSTAYEFRVRSYCSSSSLSANSPIKTFTTPASREEGQIISSTENNIQIFPNPTSGDLKIELPFGISGQQPVLRLMNLLGEVVMSENLASETTSFNISLPSEISNGVYILEVNCGKNNFISKFFLQR